MKEDSSWSSVSSGDLESKGSDIEGEAGSDATKDVPNSSAQDDSLKTMKMELAKKDKLLQNLQGQLEDLKLGVETVEKEKDASLRNMQMELAKKDKLLQHLQGQLEDLKQGLEIVERNKDNSLKAMKMELESVKKDRESAVELLQAALRTETLLNKLNEPIINTQRDVIDTISTLMEGSTTLNISELKEKAVEFGKTVMDRQPSLAATVFGACDRWHPLEGSELGDIALEKIRSNPKTLIDRYNLCTEMSAVAIERILKDPKMEADEYTMFQILVQWTKCACLDSEERLRTASSLVSHIALDLINPTLLVTEVRESGIMSDGQLIDALTKQAPYASRNEKIPYETKRSYPAVPATWGKTKTDVFSQASWRGSVKKDTVVGRAMKFGVHKWSFRVQQTGDLCGLCLGMAPASQPVGHSYLGSQPGELSLCNLEKFWHYGYAQSNSVPGSLKFQEHSTVTFALYLADNICERLIASVDGGANVVLFSCGSKFKLQHDGNGFVPAASLVGDASIRFLGFHE